MQELKFRYRSSTAIAPVEPVRQLSPSMQKYLTATASKNEEKRFAPSEQQQAFFDWIDSGSGSLILRAGAGCGKTTTLIQALRLMKGNVFFGAYNKDIAAEIKAKAAEAGAIRPGIRLSTMHGIGYSGVMELFGRNVEITDSKVKRIVDAMVKEPIYKDAEMAKVFIQQMVSFGKQFLMGVKTPIDNIAVWLKLMEHFSVDQTLPEPIEPAKAIDWTIEVYKRSHAQCKNVIDFDDMIYAAIAYGARFFKNDWVLIDEAQDLNPARRELARRLLKHNGRLIAVGDDRQAIYGFTGAGGNAIDLIKEEFGCSELPLSVTYRCPKTVVEYLYRYVPRTHILAHPSAPEGVVRPVVFRIAPTGEPQLRWYMQDKPQAADVVLCRHNAPLVTNAFAMIKDGIPCKIAGRDIGKGLITLARTWKITSLDKLCERLETYLKNEVAKAEAAGKEARAQEVEDKVGCLRIFIERCRMLGKHTIDALEAEIESMFSDKIENMLTFSSGHKAKGKEWPRVYWIQAGPRMQPKKEWEAEQEVNINYVIGSRVKADPAIEGSGVLILVPENVAA